MTKLVRLAIPSRWAVIRHSFGDEDPEVRGESIVNENYYSEDLLSIEQLRVTETGWTTDPDGYILDLGWYPPSDPNGNYRLVLLRRDWANVVVQFNSPDRQQVRTVIERCLALVNQGIDDQEIPTMLNRNQV